MPNIQLHISAEKTVISILSDRGQIRELHYFLALSFELLTTTRGCGTSTCLGFPTENALRP